ncbi:hypothetical protein VTP01DRAFT_10040 [Rhizomucor pusillus]|uniref:uncharacterized protein n=1 Tax=Rhizomucor pusillus TaxID=4840 RepID=UPI00374353AE
MQNDEYYDIDEILAEHVRIPVLFLQDIEGSVNLTGDGTEISKHSRVELPFWMAKPLAQFSLPGTNDQLVELEIPRTYGNRVRNSLDASPTAVDFRILCPYFYHFGMKLLSLVLDDQLPAIMEKAFKERLKALMNFSQTGSSSGQDFLQKLDETERELLKAGQDSTAQLRQWRDKGLRQLKSVDINARN